LSKVFEFAGEVSDRVVIHPDKVLTEATGRGFEMVVVVGLNPDDPDGPLWVSCSHNSSDSVMLLERAKAHIVRLVEGFPR